MQSSVRSFTSTKIFWMFLLSALTAFYKTYLSHLDISHLTSLTLQNKSFLNLCLLWIFSAQTIWTTDENTDVHCDSETCSLKATCLQQPCSSDCKNSDSDVISSRWTWYGNTVREHLLVSAPSNPPWDSWCHSAKFNSCSGTNTAEKYLCGSSKSDRCFRSFENVSLIFSCWREKQQINNDTVDNLLFNSQATVVL